MESTDCVTDDEAPDCVAECTKNELVFDTDQGDMGSGVGKITWPEFEAAFKKARVRGGV
eukprot:CAMPEP_0174382112 /NCGR_PEP_ID=MMETSP0811_2-20130205/124415_1 /TAXON_ID=73025 ORGANISM="Eutreptiella gymnastica-like, Strain CCMP1594" /NCGR_SAMPLE_ID=MMETSP0811_2 /ASSEMBLY_ACC=CAM_ASM_000667 /LENGTH=58 /DNA_ID=CAMNT_0015535387 /DNA_START=661 /DNA_END=837 /DNA_ORIENTATION=+